MRVLLWLLIPFALAANPVPPTMLSQAAEIAHTYAPLLAKAPPPSPIPQPDLLLQQTSNWLHIDLNRITRSPTPLATLSSPALWDLLADIGFDGVELAPLKSSTNLALDPRLGTLDDYQAFAKQATTRGLTLIGHLLGDSTGRGLDFALALKNVGAYPELYGLIEIPADDWGMLPKPAPNAMSTNIPWLTLQALHKKSYVPVDFDPYIKQSDWDATPPVPCEDHIVRRWIFRRTQAGAPKLDWLSASFAAERVAAADALRSVEQLGERVLLLDGACPANALANMSLGVRKLGAFTALARPESFEALRMATSDVAYDPFTPIASLHALIANSADGLKQIYQRFLDNNVQPRTLVHALTAWSDVPCDIAALIAGRRKLQYPEQIETDAALKERMVRDDVLQLDQLYRPAPSWIEGCRIVAERLKEKDLLALETLLIRFFAWQPGVFCMGLEDLLGAGGTNALDPAGVNEGVLYPSLPLQMQNPGALGSQLRDIFRVRRELGVERAELVEVMTTEHAEVLLLRLDVAGRPAILGLNVGKQVMSELVEGPEYVQTNAVDAGTGLMLAKPVDSSLCTIELAPRSVRLIVFRTNAYNQ